MKKIIDLTHTLCEGMPVFPGTELPQFEKVFTVEKNGFAEHRMTLLTHTGTHMDAPAHILPASQTLDQMPVDMFMGSGAVIHVAHLAGKKIEVSDLLPYEYLFKKSEFILFRSGWSRYWGEEKYFQDFPVLSVEAAEWMQQFKLKGVGVDVISVDATNALRLSVHTVLLSGGLVIENLTNLEQLPESGFTFCCFPLKLADADGSPVRAVAIVTEDKN